MSRTFIAYDNRWETGTLTYSAQDVAFPAADTQRRFFMRPWRSGALTGPDYLSTPAQAAFLLQAIIIRKTNLTPNAAVQAFALLNGNPVWSAFIPPDKDLMTKWVPGITADQVRLEFTDAANPDGYIEAGYVFAGPVFNPVRGFKRGQPEVVDLSLSVRSIGGNLSGIIGSQYEKRTFTFQATNEQPAFRALYADRGALRPFFFCEDRRNPTMTNTRLVRLAGYKETPVAPPAPPATAAFWTIDLDLEDSL